MEHKSIVPAEGGKMSNVTVNNPEISTQKKKTNKQTHFQI